MKIRDWPMDKIMSLPDHCFGRRWPVGLRAALTDANPVFDIAEAGLPERCVLWEIWFPGYGTLNTGIEVGVSLGDVLPGSAAEFDALEPVFRDVISTNGRRGAFDIPVGISAPGPTFRVSLEASGRRLVGRFIRVTGGGLMGSCVIVVSSIPSEIPDWLGF